MSRSHIKSCSPLKAGKSDHARLSQATTQAALTLLDPVASGFLSCCWFVHRTACTWWHSTSPRAHCSHSSLDRPTVAVRHRRPLCWFRGPPHPSARARIAAVQSRVAALVVSGPQSATADPSLLAFPRQRSLVQQVPSTRDFGSASGLMKHITHQHAGSTVEESTCAVFVAIERVTCSTPSCGSLQRAGARVCNRCGQASTALPSVIGDVIMVRLGTSTATISEVGTEELGAPSRAQPSVMGSPR